MSRTVKRKILFSRNVSIAYQNSTKNRSHRPRSSTIPQNTGVSWQGWGRGGKRRGSISLSFFFFVAFEFREGRKRNERSETGKVKRRSGKISTHALLKSDANALKNISQGKIRCFGQQTLLLHDKSTSPSFGTPHFTPPLHHSRRLFVSFSALGSARNYFPRSQLSDVISL